ncbi:hypothetical protein [Borrelia persica]|uniref:hypothetical protein n=1 Tax=Borrelia persica TaxID=44448 RepID=UPI0004675583|nr:hypothetical protein [Borrelia persica]
MNKFLRILGTLIIILIINCKTHLEKPLINDSLGKNNSMSNDQTTKAELPEEEISIIKKASAQEVLKLIEEILEEKLNSEEKKAFVFLKNTFLNPNNSKDIENFDDPFKDCNKPFSKVSFNNFLLYSGLNRIKNILANIIKTKQAEKEAIQAIENYNKQTEHLQDNLKISAIDIEKMQHWFDYPLYIKLISCAYSDNHDDYYNTFYEGLMNNNKVLHIYNLAKKDAEEVLTYVKKYQNSYPNNNYSIIEKDSGLIFFNKKIHLEN